jgi:HSP20 family molecular chaperone IbpA
MTAQPLETGDMIVVTVPVPTRLAAELSVTATEDVIEIVGPDGFRHQVATPLNADLDRLHAALFRDILELRAPRVEGEARRRGVRAVPVRSLD